MTTHVLWESPRLVCRPAVEGDRAWIGALGAGDGFDAWLRLADGWETPVSASTRYGMIEVFVLKSDPTTRVAMVRSYYVGTTYHSLQMLVDPDHRRRGYAMEISRHGRQALFRHGVEREIGSRTTGSADVDGFAAALERELGDRLGKPAAGRAGAVRAYELRRSGSTLR